MSDPRWPVATMPLAPPVRAALAAAGVATATDVAAFGRRHAAADATTTITTTSLARALEAQGLLLAQDAEEAAAALLAWCNSRGGADGNAAANPAAAAASARLGVCARLPPAMHPPLPAITAADMLRRQRAEVRAIPTGSAALDALLAGPRREAAAAAAAGGAATAAAPLGGGGGGGVPLGRVTEFVGAPGLGKTQLAMTLAVNAVLLPFSEAEEERQTGGGGGGTGDGKQGGGGGGSERQQQQQQPPQQPQLGEALYLDTEGSFTPERVADIAAAAVERRWAARHYHQQVGGGGRSAPPPSHLLPPPPPPMPPAQRAAEVEQVLSRVLWFRARDDCDMLAVWHMLPALLDSRGLGGSRVRLVVADSVAAPLRQLPWSSDAPSRARLLAWLAQSACSLAETRSVAVVLVNQVVTRAGGAAADGAAAAAEAPPPSSSLAPALGEAWGQAAAVRVSLAWRGGEGRVASLLKHPAARAGGEARYAVADEGVVDAAGWAAGG
jgi:RecA/RadA recombinase